MQAAVHGRRSVQAAVHGKTCVGLGLSRGSTAEMLCSWLATCRTLLPNYQLSAELFCRPQQRPTWHLVCPPRKK